MNTILKLYGGGFVVGAVLGGVIVGKRLKTRTGKVEPKVVIKAAFAYGTYTLAIVSIGHIIFNGIAQLNKATELGSIPTQALPSSSKVVLNPDNCIRAGEIAKDLGVSKQSVGKAITKLGIRANDDYAIAYEHNLFHPTTGGATGYTIGYSYSPYAVDMIKALLAKS